MESDKIKRTAVQSDTAQCLYKKRKLIGFHTNTKIDRNSSCIFFESFMIAAFLK
jgi:hypothetical protein